jgi:hypothetical protein
MLQQTMVGRLRIMTTVTVIPPVAKRGAECKLFSAHYACGSDEANCAQIPSPSSFIICHLDSVIRTRRHGIKGPSYDFTLREAASLRWNVSAVLYGSGIRIHPAEFRPRYHAFTDAVAEIVAAAVGNGNLTTVSALPPLPVLLQMDRPPQDHNTLHGEYERSATPVCGAIHMVNSTVDSESNRIIRTALRSSLVATAYVDFVKLWRLTRRAQSLANATLHGNRLLFHQANDRRIGTAPAT